MSNFKGHIKKLFYAIMLSSLKAAARVQGLNELISKLIQLVPDISEQYTTFKLDSAYLKTKARNMHAFQVSLVSKVIGEFESPVIVDIGDSAGTHSQYINGLYGQNKDIKTLSINLDPKAVEKINAKGLKAVKARAENLKDHNINADIFLCFEMLEHLMDPCQFLHQLSANSDARYLIFTVPYLRHSRVGLHHVRRGSPEMRYAENTHIFELSPQGWKLILKHSGWDVAEEATYLQYPKTGLLAMTRPLWRRFDFEGFYGAILKKNNAYSEKYMDW